ncbi:hypothetical protein [Pseudarthrobacter equi]|uniref:hypothetical protein n=1 Tax=Pseudarthrobacter equi TaxID=728066 RepID=UPI0012FE43F5|nr:hypothetical protein [Pseudarthrobacter equi]
MKLLDRSQLPSEAVRIIDGGTPAAPKAGDVWVLADEIQDLALGLITRVHDSFVSILPITCDAAEAREPASIVRAAQSPINADIAVWSPAPTGIGMHLLDRRIGNLCSESAALRLERSAFDDDVDSPFEMGAEMESDDTTPFIDFLLSSFRKFCFDSWPSATAGEAVFKTEALMEAEMTAKKIRENLNIPERGDAADLFRGDALPTSAQISVMREITGLTDSQLLRPVSSEVVTELMQPTQRDKIVSLAERRALKQRDARNLLMQNALIAARSSKAGDERQAAQNRIDEAYSRLMQE